MPPGEEGSTHGINIADGDAPRRRPRRRRIFRRPTEKKNPENLEFERQVAAFEARQEQQRQDQMTDAFMGSLSFRVYFPHLKILSDDHVQDGDSTWNDVFRGTSTPLLLKDSSTQQGRGRLLKDSANPPDDTDFLEGTFIKINSDKQKATRNKKSGKNNKKKKKGKGKGKGKSRKQSHASEMQTEPPTQPSSTCANATGGETLASSSSRVAFGVPLLEYSSSSSSSRVTAKLVITSAVNSASSGNEKELSASSSSDDFKSFESTTSYTTAASRSSANDYYTTGGNAWNCTMGDYAGSLSDARSEPSLSASDSTDSRGFSKRSGEGNKPNVHHQSFSLLAVGPGCSSQEALLCSGYSSNGGDFQKVVSRKAAQKMKRMQRSTPAPSSSTMAASGPIIARAHFPRAPFRDVITIGHYINDDTFYGRKPNQKKGKYQKVRSFSNLSSKTGYTDGDHVSGSNRMLVITTVHQAKPRSGHHVTLEAIEETNSPSRLLNPKEGELKAMAPVGDGIKAGTDSKTPSSDKPSSLGHLDSPCVDREGQKKAKAPVDGDTEESRAPSSDKTSSLGNLDNPSCVGREEQEEVVALVGGGTEDRDSRAPTSDKTSSLGYLVNSSCVDREEQQKKENRIECSTHASSELDKIIEAANNAYEVQQAASDVYTISGIHADIENFLHAATPVIGQTSCTKDNISLQDQRLWSVWSWYEEPECCGIEVQMQGRTNSSWPEFSTYFVPLLSAVQLFGRSGKSQSHGGLVFEYFELENPFSRPPIFTKIKQLRDGVNLSGNPIFGDPKQLESVKLSDLHPASWFCVAWYPICQIPAAAGSSQASFLTYHSLGKLVPQACSTDKADEYDRMICPIVGLLAYKDQGEKWFQLREQLRIKPTPNVSSETGHAELLNKRLRALRQGASIMSKAVVPRAPSGEAMNYHSDYEFFLSRSLQ